MTASDDLATLVPKVRDLEAANAAKDTRIAALEDELDRLTHPPAPAPALTLKHGGFRTHPAGAFSSYAADFAKVTATTPLVGMTYTAQPRDALMAPAELDDITKWMRADPRRLLVLSVSLIDDSIYRKFDDTRFDFQHTAFADRLAARGLADRTIVRIGWEPNGYYGIYTFPWGPASAADVDGKPYIRAFRRIAPIYRSRGMRTNWCPNAFPANAGNWYPGDDVVDNIGIDTYDMGSPTLTDPIKRWEQMQLPHLERHAAFARTHGKTMSIDEWGLVAAGYGGGDNPYHIDSTFDWAETQGFLYAVYFDSDAGGVRMRLNNTYAPKSLARYTARAAALTT